MLFIFLSIYFFLNNTDTCKCREKSKEKQTLFMIFLINVDSDFRPLILSELSEFITIYMYG